VLNLLIFLKGVIFSGIEEGIIAAAVNSAGSQDVFMYSVSGKTELSDSSQASFFC